MNKSFMFVFMLLGFACFLFLANDCHAYPEPPWAIPPVSVGQEIKLADSAGPTPGGEFEVYDYSSDDYIFNTFCIETDEYVNYGTEFIVADISTSAVAGGSGGPSPDPLDERTAYLYHHFFHGSLENYSYDDSATSEFSDRDASADALQKAIWYFEQETWGATNYYTDLAQTAVDTGLWSGLGDVRVINLTDAAGNYKQDQLTVVPEPATMVLFGVGLVGVAAFGRKKFIRT